MGKGRHCSVSVTELLPPKKKCSYEKHYCRRVAGIDVESVYKNDIRQDMMRLMNVCKITSQLVNFTQIPTTVTCTWHILVDSRAGRFG